MQAPRQRPVHGQQRESKRNHPVAEHRQETEQTAEYQQDADDFSQPVVIAGLERVELADEIVFHVRTIQVYLVAGKR
jgi:hypothetical protein